MAKNRLTNSGIVYSTNPDFKQIEEAEQETQDQISPAQQKIIVRLETKHRAGKAVTLIENYMATEAEKEALGKKLKTYCGTGGSVKEGEILVQGDNRDKVLAWLIKNGFTASRKI
jgi:translation initiation factor 1